MRVLVLCAEEELDLLAMKVLYCLDNIKAKVYVVGDGKARVYKYSRYCSKADFSYCQKGICDSDQFVDTINRCVREYNIDIVIPSDIDTVRFLSSNLDRFPESKIFPVPELATLNRLDDKWQFYRLLRELNIPTPHTEIIRSRDDIAERLPPHEPGPVIVKPTALSGGRGVKRLERSADLRGHVEGNDEFKDFPLILQEYVPGHDAGLAFLADHGRVLAWAAFHKLKNRGFIYRFERDEELLDIAQKIAGHTGYTGVAQIDMRKDERNGQVLVLECNPRLWLSMAVTMRAGLNFVSKGMDLALGKPFGDTDTCKPCSYYTTMEIVRRVRENPLSLMQVSHQNLLGILQEKTDLIAFLYNSWIRRQQRVRSAGG